jgi:hypothetical protein
MTSSLADRPQAADDDRAATLQAELAALRVRLARSEARLDAPRRLSSDWFRELDAHLRFSRCSGGGGDRRFIAFSGEPLEGRGGPHTGWHGVARDVTRRTAPRSGCAGSRTATA